MRDAIQKKIFKPIRTGISIVCCLIFVMVSKSSSPRILRAIFQSNIYWKLFSWKTTIYLSGQLQLIRFFQYHQIIFGHIKCMEICNPVSSRAHKLSTWIILFAYVLFYAKCIKESSNLSTLRCLNILQGKHDVQNANTLDSIQSITLQNGIIGINGINGQNIYIIRMIFQTFHLGFIRFRLEI